MGYDPAWPVCPGCGTRVGRYQPAIVEQADGHAYVASVLGLDARARREAARIWHEHCFTAKDDDAVGEDGGNMAGAPLAGHTWLAPTAPQPLQANWPAQSTWP